jgi:hypothetical protein
MSRTKRKQISETGSEELVGDAKINAYNARNKKLTPYIKNKSDFKFKATHTYLVPGKWKGVSAYDKLITKNANRSKKKALRQKIKLDIKKELQILK